MREFYDYLQCGILAHGFLRLGCDTCKQEVLLAFSCKRRGFCASCAGRRMAQSAAYLVERVIDLELYDQTGSRIRSSINFAGREQVSLNGLPAGIYYARIVGGCESISPTMRQTPNPYSNHASAVNTVPNRSC